MEKWWWFVQFLHVLYYVSCMHEDFDSELFIKVLMPAYGFTLVLNLCFDWLGWVSAEMYASSFASRSQPGRPGEGSRLCFLAVLPAIWNCCSCDVRQFPNVFVKYFEHITEIRRFDEVTSGCMTLSLLRGVWGTACHKHGTVICASSSSLGWQLLEKTKSECCPDTIWKLTERNKPTHMGLSRTLSAKAVPLALSTYFHTMMPLLVWLWTWKRQPTPYLPNPRITVESDPPVLMWLCCHVHTSTLFVKWL